jgi:hypothetical protein
MNHRGANATSAVGSWVRRLCALVVLASPILFLPEMPARAAEDDVAPAMIENSRVTVFDITLNPGKPWTTPKGTNFVEMFLAGARVRTTVADGRASVASRKSGDVIYMKQGTADKLVVISDTAARVVVVELKDPAVPPLPNHSGYPLAFPRPGAKKVFENDCVVAWNATWKLGVPTAVHYHDKDVVIVFRESGSIKSTKPNGESTIVDDKFGMIRFSKADRLHSEELVKGKESAIVLELK